jgi:hypothetical protein
MVLDTKPGMRGDVRSVALEPLFGMKLGGSGLGAYSSAELERSAGAMLSLLFAKTATGPAWAVGAVFDAQPATYEGAKRG